MSITNLEFSANTFDHLKLSNLSELIEFIYKSDELKGTMFEAFTNTCIYPLISDYGTVDKPDLAVNVLKEIGFDEYFDRLKRWVSCQDLLFASFDEPSSKTLNKILVVYIASQMVDDEKIIKLSYSVFNNYLNVSKKQNNPIS